MAKKKYKPVPKFASEAEERQFWETHDTSDYFDLSKAVRVTFPNLKPSTVSISLRLPVAMLEQIKIAAGGTLPFRQEHVRFHGHAIECRINAEDPETFRPSPGRVTTYHAPGGLGIRVDSAVYQGYSIPPNYDSLVGKLIVHGRNRTEALMRLRRALDEFIVDGIDTTLPLFRTLVRNTDVQNGDYDIHWLEKFLATGGMDEP